MNHNRVLRAVREVLKSLDNPIDHVWPDYGEDGVYSACYTPKSNPEEMLVVVNGRDLATLLRDALSTT